jgi:hypothetical protein
MMATILSVDMAHIIISQKSIDGNISKERLIELHAESWMAGL